MKKEAVTQWALALGGRIDLIISLHDTKDAAVADLLGYDSSVRNRMDIQIILVSITKIDKKGGVE